MAGKSHRKGLTIWEIAEKFATEDKARQWLENMRWPNGVTCPRCGSTEVVRTTHPTQTHRCRECRRVGEKDQFNVKTDSVMANSNISLRNWAIGIYLYSTEIKGVSSMKLHRKIGIGQKAAWFMLHRLRDAAQSKGGTGFSGPVEVDETYFGGKRKNMSNARRASLSGSGAVGKTAVVGMKDRDTGKVKASVAEKTDKKTLHGFVKDNADSDAKVYTDGAKVYKGLPFDHETVNHSVNEYVRGKAHTNGIESHWALMKRGYVGIYHKMSPKHLQRYVSEFEQRHNLRELDTADQMKSVVSGMTGKRLGYRDLIADNGLDNGARSEP